MKIAILYICTGKYDIFWKGFYLSCEKNFLTEKNVEKNYFVFTDAKTIYKEKQVAVKKIYQKNLGWPNNTLFRYQIFANYLEELKSYDYVFFFNANIQFLKKVSMDILPFKGELLVVTHPCFFNKTNDEFAYERNDKSLAYIPYGVGDCYICGGLNGGSGETFSEMIFMLNKAINKDYENGIIAVCHDESHINKYILNHSYKILSPSYGYPEDWELPFEPIILILDKGKYGGHEYLRGQQNILQKIKYWIRNEILKRNK